VDIAIPSNATDAQKEAAAQTLQQAWSGLAEKVIEEFVINGYKPEDVMLQPGYRMQYMGQLNDLEINSPITSAQTAADWEKLVVAFDETYARVYASSARSPELGFGVTGAILRGVVTTQKPTLPEEEMGGPIPPAEAHIGKRPFFRHNSWLKADVYQMEKLKAGNRIVGPAIIESSMTTFVVPDGFETYLDAHSLFHLKEVPKIAAVK
ncbi:MAG TPA: hypothetical protein VIK40_00040, partial [Geomonas sp.]